MGKTNIKLWATEINKMLLWRYIILIKKIDLLLLYSHVYTDVYGMVSKVVCGEYEKQKCEKKNGEFVIKPTTK